jgi:hypothetical protein
MKGLLLTMTEPLPEHEEEFNAWYDTEHFPERLAVPGFTSARRWVADEPCDLGVPATQRIGRYLATYELERPEVLDSAQYLKHVGDNATPWTKRSLGRAAVFRRWGCEQINPGDASPAVAAPAIFLTCGDIPPEHDAEFNRWYDEEHVPALRKVDGVLGARRFRARVGAPRYIALYELTDELVPESPGWRAALETAWSRRIDELTQGCEWILRTYVAYRPALET